MHLQPEKIPNSPLKFLAFSSRPYKLAAIFAIIFVFIASILSNLLPYIFKRIIDTINGISGVGPESVYLWALAYVLFSFVGQISWRVSGFTGMVWSTGVRTTSREYLTEHVTNHSQHFFSDRFAGAVGNKLNVASEGVNDLVQAILWDWLNFFIQLAITLWLVWHTNLQIALLFALWIVVITPINIFLFRKRAVLSRVAHERQTELQAYTIDLLTNINAMRDYARRIFELEQTSKLTRNRQKAGLKAWRFGEFILALNNVLEALFVGVMILVTISFWNRGVITTGDIILILAIVLVIRSSLMNIGSKFNSFSENLTKIEEGLSDILREPEIKDVANAKNLEVLTGEIILKNALFKYDAQNIFTDLNLHIKPGERIGLIGRSGAGKSTLMKLLTRQYDLAEGQILIDDQDIKLVKQESLREAIAVVPQDPSLFHRSLRDNIGYSKLSASSEDIIEAAKHAQAHNFIDSLPKKYETLVGERGVKLSGGERQRVAIARAFLKDAKVLLLDEATSSLDSESEIMIQKALGELMKGKTVIAIAHRLSTLRAMDRLIVMDRGVIVEDGTHDELLRLGGIYAELWSHQAGGFIKED